mmetsp:Transcript_9213/g.14554  ORF Transcript_9213/g.14554 Transcript_9213/m.14554 type:complete len:240 (+) Transcript_9213:152-871(+)
MVGAEDAAGGEGAARDRGARDAKGQSGSGRSLSPKGLNSGKQEKPFFKGGQSPKDSQGVEDAGTKGPDATHPDGGSGTEGQRTEDISLEVEKSPGKKKNWFPFFKSKEPTESTIIKPFNPAPDPNPSESNVPDIEPNPEASEPANQEVPGASEAQEPDSKAEPEKPMPWYKKIFGRISPPKSREPEPEPVPEEVETTPLLEEKDKGSDQTSHSEMESGSEIEEDEGALPEESKPQNPEN